tara:strand:- start:2304 stop:2819 length:516 start_codon:yes stop_codon:yes gene_type:complete
MPKTIIITGKRNIESIRGEKNKKRVQSKEWCKIDILNDEKKQVEILNLLYLEQEYEGKKYVDKEINRKLNGYKNQDVKKEVYDVNYFIKKEELIEKLVVSKLKCYYCKKNCKLMYENVREKMQWTLDRIDNDQGHNKDNVVICCLDCNLKKRTMNDEKFKFTKQMIIVKTF